MKKLIISHGDLDGLISAAVIVVNYNVDVENIEFTQPFLIDKINVPEDVEEIYISDIAVNNRNVEMTRGFIERYRDRIIRWIDHHAGYEMIEELLGNKAIVGDSPSCPQLMKDRGFTVPQEWVDAANAADRPTEYKETELYVFLNRALKYGIMSEDEAEKEKIMRTIVRYLVKRYRNEDNTEEEDILKRCGNLYEEIERNTEEAAEKIVEIPGFKYKVGYIKLEKDKKVDITRLFMLAYQTYDIVIIQYINIRTDEEVSLVGTKLKDINLVQLFNLKSGAPFRISLPGPHEEILSLVLNKLREL